MIGLLSAEFAFAGYDAAATMAEETKNPHRVAPRGMIMTCVVSFLVGVVTIVAILYGCGENIGYVLGGPRDASENLFELVFNHNEKAVAFFTLLLTLASFSTGFSNVTVISRMAFSMARDGAFPFSRHLKELDPETKAPKRAILTILLVSTMFCLLPLLSKTAYVAIT